MDVWYTMSAIEPTFVAPPGDYDASTTEPPYHVPRRAYFVMSGIIIHVGLIFNALSFVVLVSSITIRKTPSGMYLIALSVADTLVLFGEFLRWLNNGEKPFNIQIHFMDINLFACRFIAFLRYGSKLTSAWLTVAITTERLLLVVWPMKHSGISTSRCTRVTICLIYAISFILGSFPLWSLRVKVINISESGCLIDHELWYSIGSWVSLRIGSLLLPGLLVCVMTGVIIYYMTHAQRRRDRKLSSRRTIVRQDTVEVKKMALEKQLTMMLITVAVAFLILRLPYTITYYINEYKEEIWPDATKWFNYRIYAANKIADTLATLNYAINFFLYYVCGSLFRNQLKRVCTCAMYGETRSSRGSHMKLTTVTHFTRSTSLSATRQASYCTSPK